MLGYHFVNETLRDGRPIPENGIWLVHYGETIPCKSGLHISVEPFDALKYAPGTTLCKVELDGDLVSHGNPIDKWVGSRRKILARFDADKLLRQFAADQALSVKHMWDMPTIVEEYITELDESKRLTALWTMWVKTTILGLNSRQIWARDAAVCACFTYSESAARSAAASVKLAKETCEVRNEFNKRVEETFSNI